MENKVNDLWKGFAEAVLFTSYDENDEPLDYEYSIYDFDEESESRTKKLLENYYNNLKEEIEASELPLDTIGNDIWYARSGQGAGFFDHSLDSDIEEKLTKGATDMGEYADAYVGDDGKIYINDGRKFSFGGGVAVGGIVGAYLGYKIGRMRPQKAGFETEKKIGRRIKKEGKKIAKDMSISKKKPQTMEEGGGVEHYTNVVVVDKEYADQFRNMMNDKFGWDNYDESERFDYIQFGVTEKQLKEIRKDKGLQSLIEEIDEYAKGGNIKPKYMIGDVVIVDYGNNTKGEITIKDVFNPNWSDGYVYTSYENGDSMVFTEDMISEKYETHKKINETKPNPNQALRDYYKKEFGDDYMMEKGGWLIGGKKAFVFADGSKFIVELTKDKEGKQLPILVKTTQQDSTISILRDEKSLAQKTLEKAKEKNVDFKTLLIRLKNGGVFKKFYDTDGTYAKGGKLKSLSEIKEAVRQGKNVHWSNDNYIVTYDDKLDEFNVLSQSNNHMVGLTSKSGKLTHDIDDFYVKEKDGFKEVWSRFKDRTRKDFGGDKYAEGGEVESELKAIDEAIRKHEKAISFLKREKMLVSRTPEQAEKETDARYRYKRMEQGGNISYDLSDVI